MIGLDYAINAAITTEAAVRLLIMNEIALDGYWSSKQAENLLNAILSASITELLRIIDFIGPQRRIDSSTLPQFGTLETVIRVPDVLVSTGLDGLSYAQLGFYLKGDISAKQLANAKYGETHGKGACQLGLTESKKNKIHFGALTSAFYSIADINTKLVIVRKLCFRIPIIQALLNSARYGKVNGYSLMTHLEKSTQIRRAICAKMILRELETFQDPELSRRIRNVSWDLEKEVTPCVKV